MRRIVALALAGLAGIASLFAGGNPEDPGAPAIDGYDPVAYFTMGDAERGSAEFAYDLDGQTWHFVSAEHRALFADDPDTYQPWFGEHCANGLSDRHVIEADPEHWLISEGRLFLFFSARGRRTWVDGNLDEEFKQATDYYREVFGSDPGPGDAAGYQ